MSQVFVAFFKKSNFTKNVSKNVSSPTSHKIDLEALWPQFLWTDFDKTDSNYSWNKKLHLK